MKIMRQNGYTQEELLALRPLIQRNLLECVRDIVNALNKFQLELAPHNRLNLQRLLDYCSPEDMDTFYDPTIAKVIHDLLTDAIVTLLMEKHSSESYLMDSAR
jgi:hypothetical protein